MHKEIIRIGAQKAAEFEQRRLQSDHILKKGRRLYRQLRSRKHDACHICLVDYENNDMVSYYWYIQIKTKITITFVDRKTTSVWT